MFSVIYPHTSHYPDPISIEVGDIVQIGERDDEFPGWIWVTTNDGNQGWAPVQYLEIYKHDGKAKVLLPYTAKELTTKDNEILKLHFELNGWAWVENMNHESGWVPLTSIQSINKGENRRSEDDNNYTTI